MDDYFRNLQRILNVKSDLENGTYQRMTNEERLENFNNIIKKFKLMNKDFYLVNKNMYN